MTSDPAQDAERKINQRIFETSLDLILVADSRGKFIRVSPSSKTILGYDPGEMAGRAANEFLYPPDLDSTRDEMRQARYGAMTRNFECRYVHKAGHPVTLWWTGIWSAPEHQYFFIGRDVTERAEADRRVREAGRRAEQAEALLRDAIESISEGFVIYDDDDRLVMFNEAYRRFYPENAERNLVGIRFEDVLREGVAAGRFPEAAGREEAWIADRVRRHRNITDTIEQQVADGRWVLVTKHRMINGWTAGLRVDVTPLKTAQAALGESEARLALALETAGIGIAAAETEAKPALIDARFRTIYGLPEDKADIGVGEWLRLVHPDDRDTVAAEILATIGVGKQFRGEFRIRRADTGEERWVRAATGVARDGTGTIGRFLGVHIDITEQRRSEDRIRQAQKMEAIGNLTGGMAHDFNNVLGVIIGNLDLAGTLVTGDSEVGELVKDATEAAVSGAELTRRLLAFARRQPLRPQRVAVNELISGIVRLLRRTLGENIEIALDLSDGVWPVVADPAQLEAAITNLATNARDAMPEGGRLSIATVNRQLDPDYAATHVEVIPGDYAAIEVTDTGTGMPPEIVERIFEPFYTTKGPGRGTGLGLSMVFGFIKQSDGHISVYSEPGAGTTFRLYLRRALAAEEEVSKEAPAAEATPGVGETVLAVEDNPQLRRVVMRQLRQLGYRPLEADGPAGALEILLREKIDVLFTDVVMPGPINGIALARQAMERWPGIKVVLTSGFPGTKLDDQLGPLGDAACLLSKPYRVADLGRLLRETLDR